MTGSLSVVGVGLRAARQITPETLQVIRDCDRMFFLVYDPVSEIWLKEQNPRATSLRYLYTNRDASIACDDVVELIVSNVRSGSRVCAAFSGHAAVCLYPSHKALAEVRKAGFPARMLPAISTADCLFADVGIDPAREGCRTFDAIELLMRRYKLNPTMGLLLFQTGLIARGNWQSGVKKRNGIQVLTDFLIQTYPSDHKVTVYEAAVFPFSDPIICETPLNRLPHSQLSFYSTLYVPPAQKARLYPSVVKRLIRSGGINGSILRRVRRQKKI